MDNKIVRYVESLVPAVETVDAHRTFALESEKRAAADLLAKVIDIVRPSLRCIGDRIAGVSIAETAEGKQSAVGRDERFVAIGEFQSTTLFIRQDGTLCISAPVWLQDGKVRAFDSAHDAVASGWEDVEQYLSKLVRLLEASLPGMGRRSTAALKRAAQLNAALVLLSK